MCKDDLIAGEDVGSFLLVLGNKVGTLLSRPPSSDASAGSTIEIADQRSALNVALQGPSRPRSQRDPGLRADAFGRGDNFPQSHPLRVRLHPRGQERVRPSDPGVTQQHRLVPMVHTPFVALLRPDHYAPARGVMRAVLRRELQIRACSPQSRRLRACSRGPQASRGDCPGGRRPQGRLVPNAQAVERGPYRRPLGLRLKPQVQEGTQVTAYSKQKKTK
mmetsp:Transcript_25684/g.63506  ORF Transcript_25684/g.63506 Transcript_25684/m.63506 type:complete len:219 (+) Transcript_25684:702-1358(+)